MRIRYTILLIALALLSACGIKRDNPLDPTYNSSIVKPGDVGGLQHTVLGTTTPYVILEWISNNNYNTDGYYVYRSLGYNSFYAVVDTVLHVEGTPLQSYTHSSANDPSVAPGDYWYRVSAYKDYEEGRLEGRLSDKHFVRIPGK
ncbi:MAG: hypothetical protein PWP64_1176 [Candidatus Cloacimonadota bacterium]|nr:hypothetical protein [Candidatus Cloacimonadota bacterium]